MGNEKLNIQNFDKAIARLEEGLSVYQMDPANTLIRDGVIQRFEFTYELSHKTLKRYLELVSATPAQYDSMAFQDLIRSGNEQGLLLGEWPNWKRYRDMRSKTSHTYDEEVALEVVSAIPDFLNEARYFRDQLNGRLR